MISFGWEEFGAMLAIICALGFVVSSVHLVRVLRQNEVPPEAPTRHS